MLHETKISNIFFYYEIRERHEKKTNYKFLLSIISYFS